MLPRKRAKRDTVDNLYRQCQITGNCPPDVKNKVEGTTLADILSKIFSSIIYTGGLGIGTGKGTGGTGGYRPLGGTTGSRGPGTVSRPNIPVDPIGPADILPINPVEPNASSIVPLNEGDPGIIIEPPGTVNGADVELSVVTSIDPVSDVSNASIPAPTGAGSDGDAAIIDVQTSTRTTNAVRSTQRFNNPVFETVAIVHRSFGESSENLNVVVDPTILQDTVIGGDEGEFIELDILGRPSQFEIVEGEGPKTSTPIERLAGPFKRARELYNRRIKQIPTQNPLFLGRAAEAVEFGFENPAYEDDVTLTFERDLDELAAAPVAAPDPDFADIVKLSRPRLSEPEPGRVRYSRLGRRGTMTLRSGVQIGEEVHFYRDLSTIDDAQGIELSVLGHQSGEEVIIDPLSESTVIDAENISEPQFDYDEYEHLLLDELSEDFSNSHLVLNSTGRNSSLTMPSMPPGTPLKIFIDDYGSLIVAHSSSTESDDIPSTIWENLQPVIVVSPFESFDYNLHPSLRRKKRKRPYFF
ncbi:L2 protein [Vulpes vulpes papillomavirus 1]|uniref:Minor capsid protein L2 n=1 Tax=Vulpes vulpes papillomavirus 1 TaxID=1163709 RepID=A0A0A7BW04_9PAPI|nr:L2 protein [Vulpes vulpes papillomavirus 1]AHM27270.1 L2 protein [Vulpes vulpes papillomavirus 1]